MSVFVHTFFPLCTAFSFYPHTTRHVVELQRIKKEESSTAHKTSKKVKEERRKCMKVGLIIFVNAVMYSGVHCLPPWFQQAPYYLLYDFLILFFTRSTLGEQNVGLCWATKPAYKRFHSIGWFQIKTTNSRGPKLVLLSPDSTNVIPAHSMPALANKNSYFVPRKQNRILPSDHQPELNVCSPFVQQKNEKRILQVKSIRLTSTAACW